MHDSLPSNPFDLLELARDMVRRDECDAIYDAIRTEAREYLAQRADSGDPSPGVDMVPLDLLLDLLDGRIGHYRERWG